MKRWIGAAVALFALHVVLAGSAFAQFTETDTGELDVTLEVTAECAITNSPSINFGGTGLLSSNIDQQGTISVQCSSGTPYAIALAAGGGDGATVATRKMTRGGGTETVNYSLYSDNTHETGWGETLEVNVVEDTGNGSGQNHTVYGRVFLQATAPVPGTYTDAVAITVHY